MVAGSDPRGAAYGLLSLSEKMGVSPWYWWADIPVDKHSDIYIKADYVSKAPSVRYRGIFINDEDWGLYEWSAKNYEPEVGSIGPKTYRRVCELLLRLKCNMLAPAMHLCSHTFYSHPENKLVADEYGIMITTSHCEPLLFNNLSSFEWRSDRDGEWDYGTNRKTIYNKLDARVKEAAGFENILYNGVWTRSSRRRNARQSHYGGTGAFIGTGYRRPKADSVVAHQKKTIDGSSRNAGA